MLTLLEALPAYPLEHPAFAGHFPGRPIVPGVLLLDAALHALDADATGCRIANAKFLRPVAPDTDLRVEAGPTPGGGWRFAMYDAQGEVASGQVQGEAAGSARKP